MATPIIHSKRLTLRPWKVDDAAEANSLFRYASDPDIGPRCGWMPHTSAEETKHVIADLLAVDENWAITIDGSDTSTGTGGDAADRTDEPVGSITLKPVSDITTDPVNADPALQRQYGPLLGNAKELGYWIGRPFWGRGYMPEALDAILRFAFDELDVDAVWGGHYVENLQSGRVMEKCGLHVVCTAPHQYFPHIDEYHDTVVRVITAAEWRER